MLMTKYHLNAAKQMPLY